MSTSWNRMMDEEEKPTTTMTISHAEAPFLVGMKGRNVSLIRKCSGMVLHIHDNTTVVMKKQRHNANPELALRMALSACCGGVLKWFVTQAATTAGYPFERIYEFETLAASFDCELQLLRARCGHMCLMLVPKTSFTTTEEQTKMRCKITEARKALLEVLPRPPNP